MKSFMHQETKLYAKPYCHDT